MNYLKESLYTFSKNQLFVQSHSVNLRIKNRVLFFTINFKVTVEAVSRLATVFYNLEEGVTPRPQTLVSQGYSWKIQANKENNKIMKCEVLIKTCTTNVH